MSRVLKFIPLNKEKGKELLGGRLSDAMDYRAKTQEDVWLLNEQTVYDPEGVMGDKNNSLSRAVGVDMNKASEDESNGFDSFGMNYTVRYYRLIQAQLSANPPSVTPSPLTPDQEDVRRARAADDIVRYALRQYKLQEEFDLNNAQLVMYGTSFIKSCWDRWAGDPLKFDPETLEITEMEGDIHVKSCDTWAVYIDPLAKKWDEVRFIFERKLLTEAEIRACYPDYADHIIEESTDSGQAFRESRSFADRFRQGEDKKERQYAIYEYWEKGLPENGFQGRYVEAILQDGTCLTDPVPNPHRFGTKDTLPKARLPYHIMTDIDVTNQVYGNTFITYLTKIQDTMNRLDLQTLENIRAHGQTKMVLPEGAEAVGIDNSTWDVVEVKGAGNQRPSFVNTPGTMPDVAKMRADILQGFNDLAGTNESMFGQQSRETSGFSMQYATNQGNLIRRRLFNKYVGTTEGVYKDILDIIKKHWDTPRKIKISGQEGAFDIKEYEGADIAGGFDLRVEYGTSFSLDPMARRQEIMQLMPLWEKAGKDPKELTKHIKFNDLEGMDDVGTHSEKRMDEIIKTIIDTEEYVAPREWENHELRLPYLIRFMETAEFDRLEEDIQDMIIRHKEERMKMQADMAAGQAPSGGGAGGGGGPAVPGAAGPQAEGAPPMDASMAPAGPAPI